tara:strand:- start:412 stop:618 length:207 start_codon:yes stop_codon:yes gene_type:complete
MDIDFTYLKESKRDKIVDFLDKEIDNLSYLIACKAKLNRESNKLFEDYSQSLFLIFDNPDDIDTLMLN